MSDRDEDLAKDFDEDDGDDEADELPPRPAWDIRREGRRWVGDEMMARLEVAPEKMEVSRGKLYWSERDRLVMLAILLEQCGMDVAVRLGDPRLWRAAVADLPDDGAAGG